MDEPSTSVAVSGQPQREDPLQPASAAQPKGGGGLWGLLKGFLQVQAMQGRFTLLEAHSRNTVLSSLAAARSSCIALPCQGPLLPASCLPAARQRPPLPSSHRRGYGAACGAARCQWGR